MTSVKVLCVIGVGTVGIDSKLCGQWLNDFFRGRGLFKESWVIFYIFVNLLCILLIRYSLFRTTQMILKRIWTANPIVPISAMGTITSRVQEFGFDFFLLKKNTTTNSTQLNHLSSHHNDQYPNFHPSPQNIPTLYFLAQVNFVQYNQYIISRNVIPRTGKYIALESFYISPQNDK